MDTDIEFHSINILKFMGEQGMRFPRGSVMCILDYVKDMIRDKRVIELEYEDELQAVLFYSICHDSDKYLKKDTWAYKEHDEDGHIFYFEKMVAKKWNYKFHNQVYNFVTDKYPDVDILKWHKWGKMGDREIVLPVKKEVLLGG
jgi:hypothetical protein